MAEFRVVKCKQFSNIWKFNILSRVPQFLTLEQWIEAPLAFVSLFSVLCQQTAAAPAKSPGPILVPKLSPHFPSYCMSNFGLFSCEWIHSPSALQENLFWVGANLCLRWYICKQRTPGSWGSVMGSHMCLQCSSDSGVKTENGLVLCNQMNIYVWLLNKWYT